MRSTKEYEFSETFLGHYDKFFSLVVSVCMSISYIWQLRMHMTLETNLISFLQASHSCRNALLVAVSSIDVCSACFFPNFVTTPGTKPEMSFFRNIIYPINRRRIENFLGSNFSKNFLHTTNFT
jgi:hypothetical protein